MGVSDIFFRKNIKLAFSRVKEHILHIERQLKESKEEVRMCREEILNLKKEVEFLRNDPKFRMEDEKPSEPQIRGSGEVSSGNEGVYSFTHSFNKHSLNNHSLDKQALNNQTQNFQGFKQDLDKMFNNLSQQEFLTFLTIYQLEEEISSVSYFDVAKKLNLTEGCIRTYVSSLLKKGLPLKKRKHNNKQVFLHISPEFRALHLKQKLIDTFYGSDPNQKTLAGTF